MTEQIADSVRLTDNQRAVLDFIAHRGGVVSTGDLEIAKSLREWSFHPRSVVKNLAKRGLVNERYVAGICTTHWHLATQIDSSRNTDGD